jgi:hypothetical protein
MRIHKGELKGYFLELRSHLGGKHVVGVWSLPHSSLASPRLMSDRIIDRNPAVCSLFKGEVKPAYFQSLMFEIDFDEDNGRLWDVGLPCFALISALASEHLHAQNFFTALLTSVQNRSGHPVNLSKWWVPTARLARHGCLTYLSIPHEIYATDFDAAPNVKSG